MVHQVIGPVRAVGTGIAIQIKPRMIGPVIPPPFKAPFDITGANIFDLRLIADKGIPGDRVAFRPGSEMHPDPATVERIVRQQVAVRVIDKGTFFRPPRHEIGENIGLVGIIQHHPMIAVIDRDIIPRHDPVRIHHRKAKVVPDRNIPLHRAVIGVHVMHRKAQVAEQVPAIGIVARGVGKNPVAAIADFVFFHHGPRRVPDIYAVAPVIHPAQAQPFDPVALDQRIAGAVDIDPHQIAQNVVIQNTGIAGLFRQFYTRINFIM